MTMLHCLDNKDICEFIIERAKSTYNSYINEYPELKSSDNSDKLYYLLLAYSYIIYCSSYESKESYNKIAELLLSIDNKDKNDDVYIDISGENDKIVLAFKYLYLLISSLLAMSISIEHRVANNIDYNIYNAQVDLYKKLSAVNNIDYLNEAYVAANYL